MLVAVGGAKGYSSSCAVVVRLLISVRTGSIRGHPGVFSRPATALGVEQAAVEDEAQIYVAPFGVVDHRIRI